MRYIRIYEDYEFDEEYEKIRAINEIGDKLCKYFESVIDIKGFHECMYMDLENGNIEVTFYFNLMNKDTLEEFKNFLNSMDLKIKSLDEDDLEYDVEIDIEKAKKIVEIVDSVNKYNL